MKYYLLKTEQYNDGTQDKISVYTYDNANSAIAAFHKNLGASMDNEKVAHCMYIVLDQNGDDYRREAWTRPVPNVEPEVEQEPKEEVGE